MLKMPEEAGEVDFEEILPQKSSGLLCTAIKAEH